jgi:4-amino-4-deoxy-L-arabinose transferase-like glycosyltransferase
MTGNMREDKPVDLHVSSEDPISLTAGHPANAATFRKCILALLCLCVLAAAADICTFGLMDKDEGTYAAISRTMVRTGDYLVPTVNGIPWFEKPPLLFWTMALSIRAFGPHAFSVRVPSVLSFLVILALLAWWGNRRVGKYAGIIAALIFALSPLVMGLCRLGTTDMLLCCCLTAALVALWEITRTPVWSVVLGVSTGLAVLAKGPVGLGLVGLQALVALRLLRGKLRARWLGLALLIAVAVIAPWYVCVCLTHGHAFFKDFLIGQNLHRFAGGDTAHSVRQPILYLLYYVFILWLGVFPWSGLAPGAFRADGSAIRTYLSWWSLIVFGFFTLAVSKLPSYILPALPAMALLIASRLVNTDPSIAGTTRAGRLAAVPGALAWMAMTAFVSAMLHSAGPLLLGVGLAAIGLTMHRLGGYRNSQYVLPVLVSGSIAVLLGVHFALSGFDSLFMKPARSLALAVPAGERLAIHRLRPPHPSIYFYRNDQVLDADNGHVARESLRQGSYCLTEWEFRPKGSWLVVDKAPSRRKLFVLLKAKR